MGETQAEPTMILTESDWLEEKKSTYGQIKYPSVLSIAQDENGPKPRSWHTEFQVAHLINATRLEVRGTIEMSRLSAGVQYDIAYVVMVLPDSVGLDTPVTLLLEMPDGTSQSHEFVLTTIPKNKWTMVSLGEFVATGEKGDIRYSMLETTKLNPKSGLLIKDSVIWPLDRLKNDESLSLVNGKFEF